MQLTLHARRINHPPASCATGMRPRGRRTPSHACQHSAAFASEPPLVFGWRRGAGRGVSPSANLPGQAPLARLRGTLWRQWRRSPLHTPPPPSPTHISWCECSRRSCAPSGIIAPLPAPAWPATPRVLEGRGPGSGAPGPVTDSRPVGHSSRALPCRRGPRLGGCQGPASGAAEREERRVQLGPPPWPRGLSPTRQPQGPAPHRRAPLAQTARTRPRGH